MTKNVAVTFAGVTFAGTVRLADNNGIIVSDKALPAAEIIAERLVRWYTHPDHCEGFSSNRRNLNADHVRAIVQCV